MVNGNEYNPRDINGLTDFQLASSSGQWGDKNSLTNKGILHFKMMLHPVILDTTMENFSNFNPVNENGWTHLYSAASSSQWDVFETLIKKASSVNPRNNWGSTRLHLAAASGHLETFSIIVQSEELT